MAENAELEENKRKSGTHSLFHFCKIDRERYITARNKHTAKDKNFTLETICCVNFLIYVIEAGSVNFALLVILHKLRRIVIKADQGT